MDNLYRTYQKIFDKKREWKYYNRLRINEFPLNDENTAWDFIEKYYKVGEKNAVFDKFIDKSKLRNRHTVSVFFLGIILSETILGKAYKESLKPDFRYLWFISSLYHDYSYLIEWDKKKYPISKFKNIASINTHFDIKYNILDDSNAKIFNNQIVKSYFKYKLQEFKELDHGIIGGILLYDRMRKNYEIAYQRHNDLHLNAIKEVFEFKGLLWSECQYDYFAQVADTIIAHNMWFCTNPINQPTYKKYSLDELIIKDKTDEIKKYRRDENPFLFLLVIADSLEPIKRKEFEKYSSHELLEKIKIETSKDTIIVEVLDKKLDYLKWFGSIKGIEEWMQVKVEIDMNKLTIFIM